MKRMKYVLLGLVFLGIWQNAISQNPTPELPKETLRLHVSEQLVFPGERLWFSVFCNNTSDKEIEISTIAYVELINQNQQSVLRKRVLLNKGFGKQCFELPDDLSTGCYTLCAYTRWMKNFGSGGFAKKTVAVINPHNDNQLNDLFENEQTSENSGKSKSKLQFDKRAEVNFQKLLGDEELPEGNFSISVKRKSPQIIRLTESREPIQKKNGVIRYKPDYNGVLVEGVVLGNDNKSVGDAKVLLSTPGKGADLSEVRTDKDGRFRFLLPAEYGAKDLVFTLPQEQWKLKLDDPFLNGTDLAAKAVLAIGEEQLNYIEERNVYKQLEAKMVLKVELSAPVNPIKSEDFIFYAEPNRTYVFDDYVKLDSLVEYFYELIPRVKLSRQNEHFQLRVFNEQGLSCGDNPGVFVDGVFYTDFDKLARLSPDDVDKIDLFWESYFYKDFTFDGIVSIHTKKADFYSAELQENMTRVIYPLAEEKCGLPFQPQAKERKKRVPDLRYLLYWNPAVQARQLLSQSFFCSDVSGNYVMELKGYSDKKVWIEKEIEFQVK